MTRFGVVVLAICAVVSASGRQAPGPRPFVLAFSGWNGALQILGRFTGTTWINTWPAPAETDVSVPPLSQVPTLWLGQPVPRNWTLWMRDGLKVPVAVAGTRRGAGDGGGCTQPLVLALNLPQGTPPGLLDGGLAVDTDQPVEEFESLSSATLRFLRFEPLIRETFSAHERQVIDQSGQESAAELRARMDRIPIRVEALFMPVRYDIAPLIYYFVATKRVEDDHGSTRGIVISGWIRTSSEKQGTAFGVSGHAFSGDAHPGDGLRPLGVLRVASRVFWVMGAPGYESTAFHIYEVTAAGINLVLTVDGGGC